MTQVVDSRIAYIDATFGATGAGFGRPTSFSAATTGFYGPAFAVVAAPEPSGLFLLAFGGVCCLARRRRAA